MYSIVHIPHTRTPNTTTASLHTPILSVALSLSLGSPDDLPILLNSIFWWSHSPSLELQFSIVPGLASSNPVTCPQDDAQVTRGLDAEDVRRVLSDLLDRHLLREPGESPSEDSHVTSSACTAPAS